MEYQVYGLMAEYETPDAILAAAKKAYEAGYRQMDGYSPYPVEGLSQALGHSHTRIPSIVLIGAVVGAAAGFFMQYYAMAVDYPFNSGGRPLNSWPAFVPVMFEAMVLVASFAAVFGLLFLNGLPHLNHPVMSVEEFARASQDRFFLCIEAVDPNFHLVETANFLITTEPLGNVLEVPLEESSEEQPSVPVKMLTK